MLEGLNGRPLVPKDAKVKVGVNVAAFARKLDENGLMDADAKSTANGVEAVVPRQAFLDVEQLADLIVSRVVQKLHQLGVIQIEMPEIRKDGK